MAKRKRPTTQTGRVANVIRHPLAPSIRVSRSLLSPLAPLKTLPSDLRRWDPTTSIRPAHAVRRAASRLAVPFRPTTYLPSVVAFADPRKVHLCVRRETRKRVMHALGKAGHRVRKPRRNKWSSISCR